MFTAILSRVSAVVRSAAATVGIRTEARPAYAVLDRIDNVEIRRYGPRLAAKAEIETARARRPEAEAFRALARYLGGANRARSPRAGARRSYERLPMMAPVQTARVEGRLIMRLFLPSRLSRDTAPEPEDRRIRVVAMPEETMAILRFSGRLHARAVAERSAALLAALEASPWRPSGPASWLSYDPPWTLPFLRLNEVAVPVTPVAEAVER